MPILFARWEVKSGLRPSPGKVDESSGALLGEIISGIRGFWIGCAIFGLKENKDEIICVGRWEWRVYVPVGHQNYLCVPSYEEGAVYLSEGVGAPTDKELSVLAFLLRDRFTLSLY
jgi:hypothetical protein